MNIKIIRKPIFFFFFLFCIFPTSLKSQMNQNIPFDQYIFSFKDSINPNLSFDETWKKINSFCENDTQRIILTAGWFFNNFNFNILKFYTGDVINDYQTIFDSKKGLCADYAVLFSEFCKKMNIKNEIIEGYVPEMNSENQVFYTTNHAWNVVKINNIWYHCDILSFSGYIETIDNYTLVFTKKINIESLLTSKRNFYKNHIPADPIWQLSEFPLPLDSLLHFNEEMLEYKTDTIFDYNSKINHYISLDDIEKSLLFAQNAFIYNPQNHNLIVINYYNAGIYYLNKYRNNKEKLSIAKKYFVFAKEHVKEAKYDVVNLDSEIERALKYIDKIMK